MILLNIPGMIGAYGRWTTKPVLIIRAGENTKEYPNPFDSQTVGTMEDETYVTFEGNAQVSVLGEAFQISSERLKAAIRVANRMTNKPVRFLRLVDNNPHWLVQTQGVDGGNIIMTRKDIPELRATKHHTGRDGNNQIDKAAVISTAEALLAAYKAGVVDVVKIRSGEDATSGKKRRAWVKIVVELP